MTREGAKETRMMFARNVRFVVKPGKHDEFKRLYEAEVVPVLKKQNGFRQMLTLVGKDGTHGISLWNDRATAEAFGTGVFPKVVEKLTPLIEGSPVVSTYDVGATTLSA
jgi:quinol monooxygenase YgiN